MSERKKEELQIFLLRGQRAQDTLTQLIAACAPRSAIERRASEPRIKRQEAYEAAAFYLREAGDNYTATMVEDALSRIDRRKTE